MNIPLTISTCYLWGFEIIGLALFYYILTLPLYKGGVFVYIDDIILERKIGKGFFGEVWAGLWNEVPVACKKFSHLDEKDFLKEARVMK